jgi:hypothetical protein
MAPGPGIAAVIIANKNTHVVSIAFFFTRIETSEA